jgi:prophage regulatory protein
MPNTIATPECIEFLRLRQVAERLGVGQSTVWAMLKRGDFPQPTKITTKTIAWPAHVVQQWSIERIAASAAANKKPSKK